MTYTVVHQGVSVVIEDAQNLTASQLGELCGLNERWVLTLAEHGILSPALLNANQALFDGLHLSRALKARRIQQDFEASFASLGLILELMDELDSLRQLEVYHQGS